MKKQLNQGANEANCQVWSRKPLGRTIYVAMHWLILAAVVVVNAESVRATNLYWDTNSTTAGAAGDGAGNDDALAAGTWGTSSFWNTDQTGGAAGAFQSATTNSDDLFFSAGDSGAGSATTGGTVSISAAQVARSITFQEGATTISGTSAIGITLGNGAGLGGMTVDSGSGAVNINSRFTTATGGATYTNNSASLVHLQTTIVYTGRATFAGTGSFRLGNGSTAGAGSGGVTINGADVISDGNATIFGNVAGTLILNGGSLRAGQAKVFAAATLPTISIIGDFTFGSTAAFVNDFRGAVSTTGNRSVTFNSVTTLFGDGTGTAIALGGDLALSGTGGATFANGISGASRSVTVNSGTFTISGNSSYSGDTTINGGTLNLTTTGTNNIASSPIVTVGGGTLNVSGVTGAGGFALVNGQTLAGGGSITGAVTAASGSTVSPGTSPGSLVFSSTLNLQSGSTLDIDLAGTSFTLNGTENYDRVKVTGATTLAGNLSVSLDTFTLGANQFFGILDAVGGRTGTFANYAEGATVLTNGGFDLKITYLGSFTDTGTPSITGGSDVVLYTTAIVPEPSSLVMMFFGAVTLWLVRRK